MLLRKLTIVGIFAAVVLGACSLEAVTTTGGTEDPSPVDLTQSDTAPPPSSIADTVEDVLPSVVNVKVETAAGAGEGSGVVIDRNGTILTNFHVVECSVNVTVVFNDDQHGRMDGRVIGGIPTQDLAVIKVDADDLTPIELGRSSRLRLGDQVVAIGFPLGLGRGPTVTMGIVSALDRSIEAAGLTGEARTLEGLLQTDAAINPGNSGGALIDAAGRLVGINTAAAQAAQAENIGFAIAIDNALPTVEEILSEPPGDRAWLGVSVDSIDSSFEAADLGLDPDVRGAGIAGTFPGDPAAEAGIEVGDVIVAIDGNEIRSGDDLTNTLIDLNPGDVVEVELVSVEGTRTVTVELGARPPTADC
ncbi:MAG TPA: trypsin-like peptidase domain-containing protein [Actinomycetota bacterium]|nr:trypsin-like peptidase domain-containing protein [Actinomycetota bacterium]